MPSPSLPRSSSSAHNLTKSRRSRSKIPSNRSVYSVPSKKPSWVKKVGKLVVRRKDEWSKHSDLTEENLHVHNKIHDLLDDKARPSPYYKGLTDSSLVLNRQKVISSPGRESHATTVATTSSATSFINKMQGWSSSCFTFRSKGDKCNPEEKETVVKVIQIEKKKVTFGDLDEKPLRERVSEATPVVSPPLKVPEPAPVATEVLTPKIVVMKEEITKKMEEGVFTWADKYRPKKFNDFICNHDKAIYLQGLARGGGCGHFIFEGPPGVGKRTMIWAMLGEAFGADRVEAKEECKAFTLKGESVGSIQVNLKESSLHVEINLSEMKGYEKHVIVELIKETHDRLSNKDLAPEDDDCRAIILCEADKLSTDALLYMRWLLERYKGYTKLFFCCSDVQKLQAIKTLCTVVQLLPPSKTEIVDVLEFIAKQEGIELRHQLAEKIADNSKNNLRQAIRSFEATWRKYYPFAEDQVILTGWEDEIANIAKTIVDEQSPRQLYIIRGKLQDLIEHNMSPEYLFESLVGELKRHLGEQLHKDVDCLYEEYRGDGGCCEKQLLGLARNQHEETGNKLQNPMRKNIQQFLRIEEFIAKFMSWYKTWVTNNKGVNHDSDNKRGFADYIVQLNPPIEDT